MVHFRNSQVISHSPETLVEEYNNIMSAVCSSVYRISNMTHTTFYSLVIVGWCWWWTCSNHYTSQNI